jgi:hypothetical protein
MGILQAHNLILELFPAFDWSKASYWMGRDPQPQELTIAKKGVRQGEDFQNGHRRAVAFDEQDALALARPMDRSQGLDRSIAPAFSCLGMIQRTWKKRRLRRHP